MAAGPKLMQAIKKVSDTLTICPSHIGQLAALYGIRELGSWVAGKRGEMEARIAMLDHVMKGNPGGYRLVSRGAFFAYIEHPFPGKTASEAARRLLREHSVFTLPGSMFGKGQERYLRAAFANIGPRQIHELGQRLAGSSCPG
jgi:aspartate/methionine/tyrosine aminotransferase